MTPSEIVYVVDLVKSEIAKGLVKTGDEYFGLYHNMAPTEETKNLATLCYTIANNIRDSRTLRMSERDTLDEFNRGADRSVGNIPKPPPRLEKLREGYHPERKTKTYLASLKAKIEQILKDDHELLDALQKLDDEERKSSK